MRRTLYFTSPRKIEIREEPLPEPRADEVLVETLCSAISAGTEMLAYRGELPQLKDAHDSLSSDLNYPLAYGYAAVGIVKRLGAHVDRLWKDKLVFAFQPHTSSFTIHPSSLIPVPDSLPPETACFLPNMETAVNLVQDGAPILGERVLVNGQGVVGLLTASLLAEFPLDCLVTVDCYEPRRNALKAEGRGSNVKRFASLDPDAADFRASLSAYAQEGFDLAYELSGNPSALNDAIAATRFSGRVVIGSWYGQKRVALDLGGAFHRSRVRLIPSQVSTIASELTARWDKSRRFSVAWDALARIRPERWITHRVPLSQAADAYRLLEENPQETIQVLITYP